MSSKSIAKTLGTDEQATLEACEAAIGRLVESYAEAGEALRVIREGRLYRATHHTFEDYCHDKLGYAASRARQLIAGAVVCQNLKVLPGVTQVSEITLPETEKLTRPLVRFAPEMQAVVWQAAVESAGEGKVTAAHVKAAAEAFAPRPAKERKGGNVSAPITFGQPTIGVSAAAVTRPDLDLSREDEVTVALSRDEWEAFKKWRDADGPVCQLCGGHGELTGEGTKRWNELVAYEEAAKKPAKTVGERAGILAPPPLPPATAPRISLDGLANINNQRERYKGPQIKKGDEKRAESHASEYERSEDSRASRFEDAPARRPLVQHANGGGR